MADEMYLKGKGDWKGHLFFWYNKGKLYVI